MEAEGVVQPVGGLGRRGFCSGDGGGGGGLRGDLRLGGFVR